MAKYLFRANYVGKGVEGLLKEGGTKRRETVSKAVAAVGGKLGFLLLRLRGYRRSRIIEMPDVASAVATSLTINATGVVSLTLTPLILPGEVDQASKKQTSYRAPGQKRGPGGIGGAVQ